MMLLTVLSTLLMVAAISEGKIYSRCELAQTLFRVYKFDRNSLGDWVCLIENESGRNTAIVSGANKDGSKDFGLFQINSFYFCSGGPNSQHNDCNVPCSALTDENLNDDVNCARLVFRRHGFGGWYGWKDHCRGRNVQSYVPANCPL